MVKRPVRPTPAHEYLPCTYCYGYYHAGTVQQHMTDCKDGQSKKPNTLNQCRALIAPYLIKDNDELEHDLEVCLGGLSETSKLPGK